MHCKHEDSNYVAEFWRKFNETFWKVNKTRKKFRPCGWVTDMASANFNGLAIVYGEDIRSRVRGCEVHFKQSVEKISRTLGQKREEFKNLALNMPTSSTPESYSHAIDVLKIFSKDNADNVKHLIEWWDSRKENIFRAFTSFNAPQSNQAEAVHAEWKNRDKMGVSLLECCYFDIGDSILLAISFSSLEKGGHESGFGPLEQDGRKAERLSMLSNWGETSLTSVCDHLLQTAGKQIQQILTRALIHQNVQKIWKKCSEEDYKLQKLYRIQ